MEKIIKIKNQYDSLDTLNTFLKKASSFECSKDYDIWEVRKDANGQMAQCIILKKSSMHAAKIYFTNENTVKVNHIIPSKLMNAYFGKSQKHYQNILEIVFGKLKGAVLAPGQNKAFNELESVVKKAAL